jgi:ribonuclease P protein subunit POP4
VKYTSAEPFTPKFVKGHLTKLGKSAAKKLPFSRAQALYDERVRRRQLGLARRSGQKEKKKKEAVVKGEKMGRREAAEKGIWRLRDEEARCVPVAFFSSRGERGIDMFGLGLLL